MDSADDLDSMKKIAAFMRKNLPMGMSLAHFGKRMKWRMRDVDARTRISTIDVEELRRLGLTIEQAKNWAAAYEGVARVAPTNPSARGRAELMRHVARLLRGDKE